MRSCGLLCNNEGQVKRTWTWQDPSRGGTVLLPVEDGDECILIDLDSPFVPDEPQPERFRTRQEVLHAFSEEVRSHLTVSLPASDQDEYFLTTNLTIVKRRKGDPSLPMEADPRAQLIRGDA